MKHDKLFMKDRVKTNFERKPLNGNYQVIGDTIEMIASYNAECVARSLFCINDRLAERGLPEFDTSILDEVEHLIVALSEHIELMKYSGDDKAAHVYMEMQQRAIVIDAHLKQFMERCVDAALPLGECR